VLTRETPMASPPPPEPHVEPLLPGRITPNKIMTPVRARCSPAERARGRPRFPCSRKMSVFAAILIERLGYDAHVGDPRAFYRIPDGRERSEGNIFIGAYKHRLVLWIPDLLAQPGLDVINVDGIVAQKYALLLVDADHHPLFCDFLNRPGLGHV